jgi:hypothetical protein
MGDRKAMMNGFNQLTLKAKKKYSLRHEKDVGCPVQINFFENPLIR